MGSGWRESVAPLVRGVLSVALSPPSRVGGGATTSRGGQKSPLPHPVMHEDPEKDERNYDEPRQCLPGASTFLDLVDYSGFLHLVHSDPISSLRSTVAARTPAAPSAPVLHGEAVHTGPMQVSCSTRLAAAVESRPENQETSGVVEYDSVSACQRV